MSVARAVSQDGEARGLLGCGMLGRASCWARGRELGRCAPGGPRGELGWVGEGKRRWAGSGNDWAGPQGLDGFLVFRVPPLFYFDF